MCLWTHISVCPHGFRNEDRPIAAAGWQAPHKHERWRVDTEPRPGWNTPRSRVVVDDECCVECAESEARFIESRFKEYERAEAASVARWEAICRGEITPINKRHLKPHAA